MIVANIKDAERYVAINPYLKDTFAFLRTLNELSTEGCEGDGFRVIFSGKYVETSDKMPDGSDKLFEAHRKYIDVHYCISGSEGIGYADISALAPETEYNEADDYMLLSGEYCKVVLREGDFCIVFPEDAHIPMMLGDTEGKLLKAVAKVKI